MFKRFTSLFAKRNRFVPPISSCGQMAYVPPHQKVTIKYKLKTFFSKLKPTRRLHNLAQTSRSRENRLPRLLRVASLALLITVIAGSFFGLIFFIVIARDLPRPDRVVRREGFSTKIYDRSGALIYDVFDDQRRTPVQIYQIPQDLKNATVAIEDKEFFKHGGFDPKAYLRIPYYVITRGKLTGGSTLTQQLIKNVLLSSERTVLRKFKEFILALEIESKYSKEQILQMYLNEAPYGGTAWGVEEAAQTYFGKSVSQVNLIESAFLAGLPQRPSVYSPFSGTPDAYRQRTKDVLRRMLEDGLISVELANKATEDLEKLAFNPRSGLMKAPHFVMYVKKLLEDKYGEKIVETGGLRVTTSLDLKLQDKAQEIVSTEIAKVEKLNITNGAAMVMNPKTGEILAMVGSKGFDEPNYDGQVNVVMSDRQPGSAIKPVTYLTALKRGFTASTMLMDTNTDFPGGEGKKPYTPVNYDSKEHGPLQLRYSLGNSINITSVKLLAMVGIKDMLQTAFNMGFTTLEPTAQNMTNLGLSVTLGGGEVRLFDLVSAYSSFANKGDKVEPTAILKVTDKDGNVMEEFQPIKGAPVMSAAEAFIISNILSDNQAREMTFGSNSLLYFKDRQVAAKTGTTNDRKDNWAVGWTPQVITGVWVGNNDATPMKQVASGVSGASPIWRKIMNEYLKDITVENISVPPGVIELDVDKISGYLAHDGFPARKEYFIEGTEPTSDDPIHQKIKLCNAQNKLATSVDIARNDYYEKEYIVLKESDPYAETGAENRWQKGIDNWITKQSNDMYRPPTEYCSTTNQIYVKIESPEDKTTQNSDFNIKVNATSENDITKFDIYIDGELKSTITGEPYEVGVKLTDGRHTIKAIATDNQGNTGQQESRFGINVPWDWTPSPTPGPTNTPTPSQVSTIFPTATAVPTP